MAATSGGGGKARQASIGIGEHYQGAGGRASTSDRSVSNSSGSRQRVRIYARRQEATLMRRFAVALLVGTSIGGATLGAHHGYGGFFDPQQRTVLVDGTLEDLDYANPHV